MRLRWPGNEAKVTWEYGLAMRLNWSGNRVHAFSNQNIISMCSETTLLQWPIYRNLSYSGRG